MSGEEFVQTSGADEFDHSSYHLPVTRLEMLAPSQDLGWTGNRLVVKPAVEAEAP